MSVFEINSIEHLNQIVQSYEGTGISLVIKAYSDSCPPCNAIKGKYADLAGDYKHRAIFLQFNAPKCEELSNVFDIAAMPAFIVMRGRRVLKQVEGADLYSVCCAIDGI
jgi:thiol-disulfide isomerase/thioredoxin